jgi:hypothetical protein
MGRRLALASLASFALIAVGGRAHAAAPLYDPVMLNIGINCQWQQACQRRQLKAMKQAHAYIARNDPPLWRIHLCNRNARRGAARIDWIGFNNCIRNTKLARPQQRRR